MPDGCYLLNCTSGGQNRSGVAYYKDFGTNNGGNDGQQPNAFVYTNVSDFTNWEAQSQSVKFSLGVTFKWHIEGNGAQQGFGTNVGTASDGFGNWTVFRDNDAFMFTNADGFNCTKVYFVH